MADNWTIMPNEPTEAMVRKGMERLGWWTEPRAPEYELGGSALIADGLSEEEATKINDELMAEFKALYADLLAAASQPASEGKDK